jgi:hypothetical protein
MNYLLHLPTGYSGNISVADPNHFYLDSDPAQNFRIQIRIRIRIRILWAYNLTHIIQKLHFNCKRTISVISTTKKIFVTVKILKCSVWIRIRILIRIFIRMRIRTQKKVSDSFVFGYGSGSATLGNISRRQNPHSNGI